MHSNWKNFGHYSFVIGVIAVMMICIIPTIIIYMFTKYNLLEQISLWAAGIERRYFDEN